MNKQYPTSGAPKSRAAASPASYLGRPDKGWRERLFIVIFESDTRLGRWFDLVLLAIILASVVVVMLDSVARFSQRYGATLDMLEWLFTIAFTLEYLARLKCVKHPLRYATSFFGIIDLLAVLPNYAGFFMPELHALIDLRLLRLLRMFRLLKLTEYIEEYSLLGSALLASRRKILIFLSVVAILVVLNGTLLYVIEGGPDTKFSSIPTAVYFAISALTTVGFGDIAPLTDLGRAITSFSMLIGWSILAVPTGIITSEMASQRLRPAAGSRSCAECGTGGLADDDNFCRHCGARLPDQERD